MFVTRWSSHSFIHVCYKVELPFFSFMFVTRWSSHSFIHSCLLKGGAPQGSPFHSFMFVTRWSPSGTRYGCAQGQPQSHYSQPGTPGHRRCNSCKRPLHSLYNRCIAYAKHKTTAGRAFAQLNICFASHWPCVSLCHLPSLAPVYTHDTQALSNPKPSPPPPPGLYARQWMESTWMQSKISI